MELSLSEREFERTGFEIARSDPTAWRETIKGYREALAKKVDARIKVLKARGFILQQEEMKLVAALQGAPPEHVLENSRKFGFIFLAVAVLLFLGSYSLLYLTFEPFGLDPKYMHGASLTLSVLASTCMWLFIMSFHEKKWLLFSIASSGLVAAIATSLVLAVVRGMLFGTLVETSASTLANSSDVVAAARDFYTAAKPLLMVGLPLFALGLELGTGLAFHGAVERILPPDLRAYRRHSKVQGWLLETFSEIEHLRILPDTFEPLATAGALRALNTKEVDQSEKKLAIIIPVVLLVLVILVLAAVRAVGAEPQFEPDMVVITLDLTKSSDVKGQDGMTEFDKNRVAVESLITKLAKPGVNLVVLAITDDSFGNPYLLLQESIGADPGYFGEKLQAARSRAISTWKKSAANLSPSFRKSDQLGALLLAREAIQAQRSRRPAIILVSDMRNHTKQLDVETPSRLDVEKALEHVRNQGLIPSLTGASVFVLGAHAAGKDVAYFKDLERFWKALIDEAGGSLRLFTNQREVKFP